MMVYILKDGEMFARLGKGGVRVANKESDLQDAYFLGFDFLWKELEQKNKEIEQLKSNPHTGERFVVYPDEK